MIMPSKKLKISGNYEKFPEAKPTGQHPQPGNTRSRATPAAGRQREGTGPQGGAWNNSVYLWPQ